MEKFKIMFAPRNLMGWRCGRTHWLEVEEFPLEYSREETQKILDDNEKLEKEYGWSSPDLSGGELVGVLVKE